MLSHFEFCFFHTILRELHNANILVIIWRRSFGPQPSQLRSQPSQSQQSFSQGPSSQHGMFSQLSQSSLDEVLTNEQVGSHFRLVIYFYFFCWGYCAILLVFHILFAESKFSRTRKHCEEVFLLAPRKLYKRRQPNSNKIFHKCCAQMESCFCSRPEM